MTTFDARHWYRISRYTTQGNGSLTAYVAANEVGKTDTTVFFAPDDGTNLNYFRWQLFPSTDDRNPLSYVMRPWSVPGGYFNSFYDTSSAAANCSAQAGVTWNCTTSGKLLPSIGVSALWNITATTDGTATFYISNAQNGSNYHLDLWPNLSWLRMNNNITGNHPNQKFQVIDLGPITDSTYFNISSNSLLQYPGANETFPYTAAVNQALPNNTNSTPSTNTSTTATASPTPAPSHGTPIGAIVGGVVGAACVAAIIALIWFLLRRRKARSQAAYHPASSGQQSPMAMTSMPPTYDDEPGKPYMVVEETARPLTGASSEEAQEMSGEQTERVEVPGDDRRRYELPG